MSKVLASILGVTDDVGSTSKKWWEYLWDGANTALNVGEFLYNTFKQDGYLDKIRGKVNQFNEVIGNWEDVWS